MAGSREKLKFGAIAEPILVGRERELEELRHCLELAIEGKGTTIFVSGEAGSGKTRLTKEFLNIAKNEGVMILAGWCLSNAGQPYFPFIEAFESHYSTVDSALTQQQELKSWLSGQSETEEREITPQLWKDRTFAAITKELLCMSTRRPIILFIDDIHWADSASLALLHYISRTITSERLLIIATFRTEEISSKVEGQSHPLAGILRLMAREELFKEIKLENLSQSNVAKIAGDMLRGSLDSEFTKRLSEESQGNPLFVVEALRMMYDQGSLVQKHGRWHIRNETIQIPTKVKDVITQRLEALKPNERRILDAASAVGEKFDPKLVAAVLSQSTIDVLEALNTAAQNTLLVFCEGNHYRFKHAKIHEMLYEKIPPILKGEFHSRIAEEIEVGNKGLLYGSTASDLTYHYVMAGNQEKAIKYALAAGRDELAKWSNTQAIKHFTYVVEAVREDPDHAKERECSLNGLGEAFYAESLFKDAERTFEELASIAQENAVKLRALRMAMYSAFSLGDSAKLSEFLKKAEPYSAYDRLENARVLMLKGRVFTLQHKFPASIEANENALQVFEEEGALTDVALCLMSIGSHRVVTGEQGGLADSLFALALFEELGAFNQQMIACYLAGRSFGNFLLFPEALNMYKKIVEIYERTKVGNYSALALGYAFTSQIFECLGDFEKAVAYSMKAIKMSSKTDTLVALGVIFCNLVIQYARLGNLKRAEEYFEKLSKLPLEIRSHYFVSLPVAKAALSASKNQWKESNQYFTEFLEPLGNSPGAYWDKFSTSQLYAWALERQERFDKSKILLEQTRKMQREAEEMFEHANVKANLAVHRKGVVGVELEMRLSLVNLARKPGTLFKVEGLIPLGCRITSLPSFCSAQNGFIGLNQKSIEPFQVEPIILKVTFSKAGIYYLKPTLSYVDDLGKVRPIKLRPVTITVQHISREDKLESSQELLSRKPAFKCEATEKAFTFLVSAFEEDYVKKKLAPEKSGWRTLMEVVKNAQITKHSMYGQSGRGGEVISELRKLGLVESRFFTGERGRGGRVLRIRICNKRDLQSVKY